MTGEGLFFICHFKHSSIYHNRHYTGTQYKYFIVISWIIYIYTVNLPCGTKRQLMKRKLFLALFVMITVTAMAQSNRTVETQKDRYGHVTGTATTTTDSRGNKKTVYKDRYGHITGRSETRVGYNGQSTTTYKDPYGHITGSSTTKPTYNGTTTTYKDPYGHVTGSSTTRPTYNGSTTTYKDRYGNTVGTSTTK